MVTTGNFYLIREIKFVVDCLPIVVYVLIMHLLTSLSIDEILLPRLNHLKIERPELHKDATCVLNKSCKQHPTKQQLYGH